MKNIYSIIIILAFCQGSFGQILNGSFEEWTTELNYEKPTFWETNQDSLYTRIQKDTCRIDGDFSIKFTSNSPSAWVDCNSHASLSTRLNESIVENQHISFYLKSIPVDTHEVFFQFTAYYYKDNQSEGQETFMAEETYEDFSLIELADIPFGVDSIQIFIFSGAINGADDGCYQRTTSWVDGLRIFKRTSATKSISQNGVKIYPNPSNGNFNIQQSANKYKRYRVLNILGKEIKSGTLENSNFSIPKSGPYILQLYSEINSNRDIVRKIIVL